MDDQKPVEPRNESYEPKSAWAKALVERMRTETPEQRAERQVLRAREDRALAIKREDEATGAFLYRCGLELDEVEQLTGVREPPTGKLDWASVPFKAVADFMAKPDAIFLVLMGTVGTGKSLAAASAMLALRPPAAPDDELGPKVRYWPVRSPGVFITASEVARAPLFGEAREDFDHPVLRCPLLVIDDLGAEPAQMGNKLVEVIDARRRRRGKTIITTNCTTDLLRSTYGERAIDRLLGERAPVVSTGPSLRRTPRSTS